MIKRIRKLIERYGAFTFIVRVFHYWMISLIAGIVHWKLKHKLYTYFTKDVRGNKMWLSTHDRGITVDLFINEKREPFFYKEFITHVLKPGQVVIDIGANIGYYALAEAKIVNWVHAIEPVSKNIELLNMNMMLNRCGNVSTYQQAIGNFNGQIDIGISEHSNLCSINNTVNKSGFEVVRINTLDNFISKHNINPDVIRMDVEAYCFHILEGATKALNDGVILCMELHNSKLEEDGVYDQLVHLLKYMGYEIEFASQEPYSMFPDWLRWLDKGFKKGILNVKIDDLLDKKYRRMDGMEVVLRK